MKKTSASILLFLSIIFLFPSTSFANNNALVQTYIDMEKAVFEKSSFNYTDETLYGGMVNFKNGTIGGKIDDFDNDSKDELLVFKIEKGGESASSEDIYGRKKTSGTVIAEMYEEKNGKVIKTDSFSASEFLDSDTGEYEFFIKTENNKKYIAIQNMSYASCFADGVIFNTQICSYNGTNFENKLSLTGGGSSFEFNEYYSEELKALREMGFSVSVNQMLEGYIIVNLTKFDLNIEKVVETLVSSNSTTLGETYGYTNLEQTVKKYGVVNVAINNYTNIDGTSNSAKTISVILNENELTFNQPPYIENGTTMVPMRAIFEALGSTVNFDANTKTITASKNNTTISLTLGSDKAYINSIQKQLGTRVKSLNGTSMVPLRFISEAFGAEVSYNGIDKIITITLKN